MFCPTIVFVAADIIAGPLPQSTVKEPEFGPLQPSDYLRNSYHYDPAKPGCELDHPLWDCLCGP